jgi:hypothetical protein
LKETRVQIRSSFRFVATGLSAVALAAGAGAAFADSTPVGRVPAGPVLTVGAKRGLLVAIALPRPAASKGLVWRLARPLDPKIMREVTEADVGSSVVVVYKATGKGRARIVYALTRGDASPVAVRSSTTIVRVS